MDFIHLSDSEDGVGASGFAASPLFTTSSSSSSSARSADAHAHARRPVSASRGRPSSARPAHSSARNRDGRHDSNDLYSTARIDEEYDEDGDWELEDSESEDSASFESEQIERRCGKRHSRRMDSIDDVEFDDGSQDSFSGHLQLRPHQRIPKIPSAELLNGLKPTPIGKDRSSSADFAPYFRAHPVIPSLQPCKPVLVRVDH